MKLLFRFRRGRTDGSPRPPGPVPAPLCTPVFALLLWALPTPGHAQAQGRPNPAPPRSWPVDPETAPRPVARATFTPEPIVVDGRLTEDAWKTGEPVTELVQREPRTGYPGTERTEITFLYDQDAVYVGAVFHDADMGGLMYGGLENDFQPTAGDMFVVTLDTFRDRRNGFVFAIDPSGAVWDAQISNDGRTVNRAWDGVVHVKTEVTDTAWVVEMAIPLTTLRFDPSRVEEGWGLQLLRRIRRKNEWLYWAPLDRAYNGFFVSRAGALVGLSGLRQGRNLTVKPYLLAEDVSGTLTAGADEGKGYDAGVDLKYGLTPGVTMDLTYRTDFAQVEVDQEQVNLTRFPLFFPEQRDFFLENAGIFTFGDARDRSLRTSTALRDFVLFHTRRIGLAGGRPIPIVGGGRITGRLDRYEFGLLNMQTESAGETPSENFTALRLRRNILRNSEAGVILLNREAIGADGGYNRSYGADLNLHFLGRLFIDSYLAGTEGSGEDADGTAGRISVGWRDRLWNTSAFVKRVGRNFGPGLGFVPRRGIHHFYGTVGVHPRPRASWLQEVNPFAEVDYITDLRSALETRIVNLGFVVKFWDSATLSFEYEDRYERLEEPFRVFQGAVIPAGSYDFRDVSVRYQTGLGRDLNGNVRVSSGGFFDGEKRSVGLGADWRLRYDLKLELLLDRNEVELPDASFTADVGAVRVEYAFSTRLFGSAFVQYNAESDQMVTSIRVDLRYSPLSNVFLVYTKRRDLRASVLLERLFSLKATRLLAF